MNPKNAACPFYWHITIKIPYSDQKKRNKTYTDHIPYCRLINYAMLGTGGFETDQAWSLGAATHHAKQSRVRWKGEDIKVCDDSDLHSHTRISHGKLHQHGKPKPKRLKTA
jgi:hypothetical protein